MSCGIKAWHEDEELREEIERRKRLESFVENDRPLDLFDEIKQLFKNMELDNIPMTRINHDRAWKLAELLQKLP